MACVGDEVLVQGEGLWSGSVRSDASSEVGLLGFGVHQGKLGLLVNRKLGMHETLVVGVSLFNFSHMPFAYMGGVITSFLEHFGECNFFTR